MLIRLLTMIKYETRMQWRRKSWWIISGGFLFFLFGGLLFTLTQTPTYSSDEIARMLPELQVILAEQTHLTTDELTQSRIMQSIGMQSITHGLWIGLALIVFVPTLFVVEIIPLDRQYGMSDLLHSLPLSDATYITGKVLSVWVNLLVLLLAGCLVYALIAWLAVGPFDLRVYFIVWLVAFLPASLLISAVSVLCGALVSTRRKAYLIGFLLMIPAGLIMAVALIDLWAIVVLVDPVYYFITFPGTQVTTDQIINTVISRLATFAGIIIAVWITARSLLCVKHDMTFRRSIT